MNCDNSLLSILRKEFHVFNKVSFDRVLSLKEGASYLWYCSRHRVRYVATLGVRLKGRGCDLCTGKAATLFNNVLKSHPHLYAIYDVEKNTRPLSSYLPFSADKVYWKCNECGYGSFTSIAAKVRAPSCRRCVRSDVPYDVSVTHRELEFWYDDEKNIQPFSYYHAASNASVFWCCPDCRHSFEKSMKGMTRFPRCETCDGKSKESLFDRFPDLSQSYSCDLNPKTSSEVYPYSEDKVWWNCSHCSHSYSDKLQNVVRRKVSVCTSCRESQRFALPSHSCLSCGTSWEQSDQDRGEGHLHCSGCRSDISFGDQFPDLQRFFCIRENNKTVFDVSIRDSGAFWWDCSECDSKYKSTVRDIVKAKGSVCPSCIDARQYQSSPHTCHRCNSLWYPTSRERSRGYLFCTSCRSAERRSRLRLEKRQVTFSSNAHMSSYALDRFNELVVKKNVSYN